MYQELLRKEKKLAVMGLGYVGLPIALEFAKKFSVIGFDINEKKIEMMRNSVDPSSEVKTEDFQGKDIVFTADLEALQEAHFFVVAVPTPVDKYKVPNLKPIFSASETIGKILKPGDYVVYESTVYPGCTEEDCIPILEEHSGLVRVKDFKMGYSPERINLGDAVNTIATITKIVSGCDDESLKEISKVYGSIITAGVYEAQSIKVAEAAKVIENAQRDLNISFMNELAIIFDKMDINTQHVINAAATKWNFQRFFPGLVGGHCIGVDPYYLTYKAKKLGYHPQVILSGRRINDGMPAYVAKKAVQLLIKSDCDPKTAKVLVLGITFKENVTDIRNSKVADLIHELKDYSINVEVYDPYGSAEEVREEYGIEMTPKVANGYDAVIIAVNHKEFTQYSMDDFKSIMKEKAILMDIKGVFLDEPKEGFEYWSL